MKPSLMIFALIGLGGCIQTPQPTTPIVVPPPGNALEAREPDSCGAMALTPLIGQPEGMIRTVRMTQVYRVIPLGAMVTQDYSAMRVNFHLNEHDLIARIDCG